MEIIRHTKGSESYVLIRYSWCWASWLFAMKVKSKIETCMKVWRYSLQWGKELLCGQIPDVFSLHYCWPSCLSVALVVGLSTLSNICVEEWLLQLAMVRQPNWQPSQWTGSSYLHPQEALQVLSSMKCMLIFFLAWLEQWVMHFFHRKYCEVTLLHKHSVMCVGRCVTKWPGNWCTGSLLPLTVVKLCRTICTAQYLPGLAYSMCKTFVIKRHHTTHLTSTIEHNFNALKMKLQGFKLWINVKFWHKEENFYSWISTLFSYSFSCTSFSTDICARTC